ncbi:hypothetical protein DEO72_LG5g1953 [Vigna unguiculata]|uniref:Uncharacterized protein n=1 Tax=Vigna unguiculata TaxID=3917 RepID=A0A4D6LYX1_VIGUN|nr:hypothetical protein DEO72_LG5g1953 [Vigna unguiculata]
MDRDRKFNPPTRDNLARQACQHDGPIRGPKRVSPQPYELTVKKNTCSAATITTHEKRTEGNVAAATSHFSSTVTSTTSLVTNTKAVQQRENTVHREHKATIGVRVKDDSDHHHRIDSYVVDVADVDNLRISTSDLCKTNHHLSVFSIF